MKSNDEEWIARRLAEEMRRIAQDGASSSLEVAAETVNAKIRYVDVPGDVPGSYDPILCCPSIYPEGMIILNSAYHALRQARAFRHELCHHLLWPTEINVVFGRFFPLNPREEGYLLRERIVQRAEQICFGGK